MQRESRDESEFQAEAAPWADGFEIKSAHKLLGQNTMTGDTVMIEPIIKSALDEGRHSVPLEVQKTQSSATQIVMRVIAVNREFLVRHNRSYPFHNLYSHSCESLQIGIGQILVSVCAFNGLKPFVDPCGCVDILIYFGGKVNEEDSIQRINRALQFSQRNILDVRIQVDNVKYC